MQLDQPAQAREALGPSCCHKMQLLCEFNAECKLQHSLDVHDAGVGCLRWSVACDSKLKAATRQAANAPCSHCSTLKLHTVEPYTFRAGPVATVTTSLLCKVCCRWSAVAAARLRQPPDAFAYAPRPPSRRYPVVNQCGDETHTAAACRATKTV